MDAASMSSADLVQDNNIQSDSDTNPDDALEYYQPIAAVDYDGQNQDSDQSNSDNEHRHGYRATDFGNLDNGYCTDEAENGISSLHLGDDADEKSSEDDEQEDDMRMREASDSAILRAFREDETRRNAPLSPENAVRVMEAMRGISFTGLAPDWVGRVPENQWIDQLRRLTRRQTPSNSVPN